jgi:EmrB/QacA subfamily drug resistance transporter
MPVEPQQGRSPWSAFGIVATAVFLSVLDLFIVNIAFPDIHRDFSTTSLSDLSWVLSAYAIVFAAVLVPAGKLADLYGRKRIFLGGLIVFLVGSALAAAAPSADFLIGARVVQSIGGAAVTPTSIGLVLPLFSPRRHATVIGLWAAIGGVGAAAGPALGGLLVQASWRWIFLINLPIGAYVLIRGARVLEEIRDPERGRIPDLLGSALLVSAIGTLTLSLVKGPDWSWDARTVASFASAAALLALFTVRSARHPAPVVELALLRVPAFALSSVGTLLFYAAFAVLLIGNVLFLTEVWAYSVTRAAFAFVPGPAMAAITAVAAGRLASRLGSARVGVAGGIVYALASAWFLARLGGEPQYLTQYLPGQMLGGIGVGLILPAFTALAASTLPPTRLATGIGVQTTFRQIGAALGLASFVAIVGQTNLAAKTDFDGSWLFMAVASAGAALVLVPLGGRRSAPASTGDVVAVPTAAAAKPEGTRRGATGDGRSSPSGASRNHDHQPAAVPSRPKEKP